MFDMQRLMEAQGLPKGENRDGRIQNSSYVYLPGSMSPSESYPSCLPDAFDNYLIGLQSKKMLFALPFRAGRKND